MHKKFTVDEQHFYYHILELVPIIYQILLLVIDENRMKKGKSAFYMYLFNTEDILSDSYTNPEITIVEQIIQSSLLMCVIL